MNVQRIWNNDLFSHLISKVLQKQQFIFRTIIWFYYKKPNHHSITELSRIIVYYKSKLAFTWLYFKEGRLYDLTYWGINIFQPGHLKGYNLITDSSGSLNAHMVHTGILVALWFKKAAMHWLPFSIKQDSWCIYIICGQVALSKKLSDDI